MKPSIIQEGNELTTDVASVPVTVSPTGSPTAGQSQGLSTVTEVAITVGAIFGVLLVLTVIFLGHRLHQVTRQQNGNNSVSGEKKVEPQPQLRLSRVWRRLIAVELPTTERACEVQGAEVVRISGLYELDGRPRKRREEVKSWFSWSTR
jgi:hypothetical protein